MPYVSIFKKGPEGGIIINMDEDGEDSQEDEANKNVNVPFYKK